MKKLKIRLASVFYSLTLAMILIQLNNFNAIGQNITNVEYFFDTDPGFGLGGNISVTPAPNLNNLQFTIPLSSISAGFHSFYVRAKDENGCIFQLKSIPSFQLTKHAT